MVAALKNAIDDSIGSGGGTTLVKTFTNKGIEWREVPSWQAPVHIPAQIAAINKPKTPVPVSTFIPVDIIPPGRPAASKDPYVQAIDAIEIKALADAKQREVNELDKARRLAQLTAEEAARDEARRVAAREAAEAAARDKKLVEQAIADQTPAVEMAQELNIAPTDMGLFKSIFNKISDSVIDKSLSKTNFSDAKKQEVIDTFNKAKSGSQFEKNLNTFDKIATTAGGISIAAASVLVPGLGSMMPTKGSGPISNLQNPGAGTGPIAAAGSTQNNFEMPAWLLPVAFILGGLLLFRKKIRL
jgi:hypothetical protein